MSKRNRSFTESEALFAAEAAMERERALLRRLPYAFDSGNIPRRSRRRIYNPGSHRFSKYTVIAVAAISAYSLRTQIGNGIDFACKETPVGKICGEAFKADSPPGLITTSAEYPKIKDPSKKVAGLVHYAINPKGIRTGPDGIGIEVTLKVDKAKFEEAVPKKNKDGTINDYRKVSVGNYIAGMGSYPSPEIKMACAKDLSRIVETAKIHADYLLNGVSGLLPNDLRNAENKYKREPYTDIPDDPNQPTAYAYFMNNTKDATGATIRKPLILDCVREPK